MTPEEENLLARVRESPEDDGPRLVYADWLEENGRPERAEFIRVQIVLANEPEFKTIGHGFCAATNPGCWHCFREPALREREKALFPDVVDAEMRPFESFGVYSSSRHNEPQVAVNGICHTFRRGFVARVTLTAEGWLQNADNLLARFPIEEVRLMTWPGTEVGQLIRKSWPGVHFVIPAPGVDHWVGPPPSPAKARNDSLSW